jgi:hypothetical protein
MGPRNRANHPQCIYSTPGALPGGLIALEAAALFRASGRMSASEHFNRLQLGRKAGDFNTDGIVGAANYRMWRKTALTA